MIAEELQLSEQVNGVTDEVGVAGRWGEQERGEWKTTEARYVWRTNYDTDSKHQTVNSF